VVVKKPNIFSFAKSFRVELGDFNFVIFYEQANFLVYLKGKSAFMKIRFWGLFFIKG